MSTLPVGRYSARGILLLWASMLVHAVATSPLSAQVWTRDLDTELKNPILSPGGLYMVYGNDDTEAAECVEVATGRVLWTRPLEDFDKWEIMRFVGDSVVLMGQLDRYEFVRPSDGEVLSTIKLIDKDWDELTWEHQVSEEGMEPIRPHFRANIGIFYFDDGIQILDLEKRTVIMESDDPPSKLQYREWGNVTMILSRGGSDSIWAIDYKQRKVILRASQDDYEINTKLYQPFALNDAQESDYDVEKDRDESPSATEMLLFNDENIVSLDPADGSVNATIDIETDDVDFFFTVLLDKQMHIFVCDDDEQRFYRSSTGELLWTIPKDTIPGFIDKVQDLGDGNGLLFGYNDDIGTLYKVNMADGSIAWRKPMFRFRGGYEPGHREAGGFGAALKTMMVSLLINMVAGPAQRGGFRVNTYTGLRHYPNYLHGTGQYQETRFTYERSNYRQRQNMINNIHQGFLAREKKVKAYMDVVSQEGDDLVLVIAGDAHNYDNPNWREAEEEGIYRLNLKDGSIVEETKTPLLADKEGKLNAYADLQLIQLPVAQAQAIIGIHDVYIVRKGAIERSPYGEETIVFLGNSDSTVSFQTDLDEDRYDIWTIDASVNPSGYMLAGRSDEPNLVASADTTVVVQTIQFNDYTITGHPVVRPTPGNVTMTPASWTLTEDDIDDLDIGSLTRATSFSDQLQGIRSDTNGVLLMGDDGVAFISSDGSCRWSREWNPNKLEVAVHPKFVGNYLVYGLGDDNAIVRLDCSGTDIAYHDISYTDSRFLITDPELKKIDHHIAIILDIDDGLIWCYELK